MLRINGKLCFMLLAGLITYTVFAALSVSAAIVLSDDGWYETLENKYLGVAIGGGGTWEVSPPFLHVLINGGSVPIPGRFAIWTIKGDPTVTDDDSMEVVYSSVGLAGPGDKWGAWQVMVDGNTAEGAHAWATFPTGGTSGIWGDTGDGAWEVQRDGPYIPTNENVIKAAWYPIPSGGVEVDPAIGCLPVRCELETRLMRDTVRFKWTIKNEDTVDHLVGLRVYADLVMSGEDTGTTDLRNIVSIPGQPLLENKIILSGIEVPAYIDMVNSQRDPVISVRPTFRDNDATPPDKVGIDDWRVVAGSSWTYGIGTESDTFNSWKYEPLEYTAINDVAYGAFWKPRRISPGQTITIIHYLGLGCSTSDFTKPNLTKPQYTASVQGPRALKYYTDAGTGVGQLYPSAFTISAYMENQEKYMDLQSPGFTLMLPDGLTLDASEGGKYTKTLNHIDALSEGSVSWQVKVDSQFNSPTGIRNYSVSFTADPVGGTTVSRDINIPATEWQSLSKNWQMISVPFDLTDSDPSTALGFDDAGLIENTDYRFYQYDPYLRQYKPVYSLVPGQAYWLSLSQAAWLELIPPMQAWPTTSMTVGNYSPIQWSGTQGHQIPMQTGWNLIGNPYVYTITFGELRFYHRDYGVMDYDQAVARGMISKTVFWWDPVWSNSNGKYNWSSLRSVQFKPWQGYWVKVMRSGVTMIVTPVSQIGASLGGVPDDDDGGGGGVTPPSP